jgi:hypothetical protein
MTGFARLAVCLGAAWLAFPATPVAAQQQPAPPRNAPALQGFSVVLVLGNLQSEQPQDKIPPAARKALTDLKDFLPYKGFQLLDTQWISCCGQSANLSRLRGPDDQEYDLELTPMAGPNGKWGIHFILHDTPPPSSPGDYSAAAHDKEIYALTIQRNDLERKLADMAQSYMPSHPQMIQGRKQLDQLNEQLKRAEAMRLGDLSRRSLEGHPVLIDTSFTMDTGETVVVGTSRLKGDKALIALLTASPQRR